MCAEPTSDHACAALRPPKIYQRGKKEWAICLSPPG